jgi:hypothetical protein
MLFLTVSLPRSRAVELWPGRGVGLITRDGASLAYVGSRLRAGSRWISTLTVHGDGRAADELDAAIRQWDALGRPGPQHLHVSVDYRRGKARLRQSWRAPL